MLKKLRNLFRYVGRRGYSLLFFGLVLLVYGQAFYTTPPAISNSPAAQASLWAQLHVMPLGTWGVLWLAAGVLCVTGVFWKRLEATAFAIAASVMAAWSVGYAVNHVTHHGYRSYIGFIIYLAFSAFILLISGWPEEKDYGK